MKKMAKMVDPVTYTMASVRESWDLLEDLSGILQEIDNTMSFHLLYAASQGRRVSKRTPWKGQGWRPTSYIWLGAFWAAELWIQGLRDWSSVGEGSWESLTMCHWNLGGLGGMPHIFLRRPKGWRLAKAGMRWQGPRSQKKSILPTPASQTSRLQSCEKLNSCWLIRPVCGSVWGRLSRLL